MIAWKGALLALLFLVRYWHQITLHASLLWLHSTSLRANRLLRIRSSRTPTIGQSKPLAAICGLQKPRLAPVRS